MRKISKEQIGFALVLGVALGIGIYTFLYAKGTAYLTNNPEACTNCHVMQGQYDSWLKSSHHSVAVCNDCHTPHDFIGKYKTKFSNGFKHSYYFTVGGYPEEIQIAPHSREITEKTCRHCHEEIVSAIDFRHDAKNETSCLECHRSVGHLH